MSLLVLLSRDPGLYRGISEQAPAGQRVLVAGAWSRLQQYLLNRPVTSVLVDLEALSRGRSRSELLRPLREGFPRTPIILLARQTTDPAVLFDLGRAGLRHLVLVRGDGWDLEFRRTLADAGEEAPPALVTRRMAPYLPVRPLAVLRAALESVHQRPAADGFARAVGLSRPFLSECLKSVGLPSVGHLLLWARLLYAGHWLEEPARSGESVARQLEYSTGSAFRRALKHYTGATPTEVATGGGLAFVFQRFVENLSEGSRGVRERASQRASIA